MRAATSGSLAITLRISSYAASQYLVLCMPSAYCLAKTDSVWRAVTAVVSWVMGCMVLGKERMRGSMWSGSLAREWSSSERALAWSAVGHSPVMRSQRRASGPGSPPSLPPAGGSSFWRSGMVRPRKRIPSSASRREVSQIMHLTPRAPPMACSTVTSPRLLEPYSALSFLNFSCSLGMTSRSFSLREVVARPRVAIRRTDDARKVCMVLSILLFRKGIAW
mmetsp:Transcript_10185/g.19950  ORF Transcript_10185/g.19950 Transcript_10185/m.19950 type:complete len:221 (+) Transcript_10185:888-1550(+)